MPFTCIDGAPSWHLYSHRSSRSPQSIIAHFICNNNKHAVDIPSPFTKFFVLYILSLNYHNVPAWWQFIWVVTKLAHLKHFVVASFSNNRSTKINDNTVPSHEHHNFWNNRKLKCLFNNMIRPTSKKTSHLCIIGPWWGGNNAESVSAPWRHHSYVNEKWKHNFRINIVQRVWYKHNLQSNVHAIVVLLWSLSPQVQTSFISDTKVDVHAYAFMTAFAVYTRYSLW